MNAGHDVAVLAQAQAQEAPRARAFGLQALLAYSFPPRKAVLLRGHDAILREGHVGQVAAIRGVGKTWLLQTLALVAASGGEALGIHAAGPSRVLIVDGEMASEEIQARLSKLCGLLHVNPANLPLSVIGADWQDGYLPRLDSLEGQQYVAPQVDAADLVILDNRSCLFDPEGEKDATAWQPAQDYLLSLRRRGKAVLLGHHANRQGGARGHSKAEDMLNVSLKLSRPTGYTQDQGARFLVEFDKARGIHGGAAAPFIARLTEDGWDLESADSAADDGVKLRIREYLTATNAVGERPKTATATVRGAGVNKQAGLLAFAGMVKSGEISHHAGGGYCLA